jgi:transcriptional regulator with XRE-family HTH domain
VALLAGVSPTWYIYLEQGRDIRPSTQVLDQLANVLRLSQDERNYLHLLAMGHRPLELLSPPTSEILGLMTTLVNLQALPCYVANSGADILAWNQAAQQWYTDFGRLPEGRRNLLWWVFTSEEAQRRFVHWEVEAQDLLGRVRSSLARVETYGLAADDSSVQELLRLDAKVLERWQEVPVRDHVPRRRTLRRDDGVIGSFSVLPIFELYGFDCGVVFHFPADEPADEPAED